MRLSFIPPQFFKTEMAHRADLMQIVVGGVWQKPGTSAGRVRLWKVNLPDLSDGGEIPFDTEAGKDDSVAIVILDSGDVLVAVSEALPGGVGVTSQPAVYPIYGVFPQAPGPTDELARAQAHKALTRTDIQHQRLVALDTRVDTLEKATS